MEEILVERMELLRERLSEMQGELTREHSLQEGSRLFFSFGCAELGRQFTALDLTLSGKRETLSLKELQDENLFLYEKRLPGHYEDSFYNPAFAAKRLGSDIGPLLSAILNEVTSRVTAAFVGDAEDIVIRGEMFVQLYGLFLSAAQEEREPGYEEIREIFYYYHYDYADLMQEKKVRAQVDASSPECIFLRSIVEESDLSDLRYLYRYGVYISEDELGTARYLQTMPEETIAKMADTFTEGYRMGFVLGGKDLAKNHKETVDLRYSAGFERMMRRSIDSFAKMGLSTVIRYLGLAGGILNEQLAYDHREDDAFYLDGNYKTRYLETRKEAFEAVKEKAKSHAGPAVLETFGQVPFSPIRKKEAPSYNETQRKLHAILNNAISVMNNTFIPGEERSFTIISFPVPAIGHNYEEIFQKIIKINTLDYTTYQKIQEKLIDALNQADHVVIKGSGENRTDLQISLHKLNNPEKETNFENCVADVNIPVGEVFTSPVLHGTNGTLHVKSVYLEGLVYKDLQVELQDGMTSYVTCSNFATKEEGEAYVRENVLFHHPSLPVGEFAIGTNTTAYVVARELGIEGRLPILIAEKMGPHFALGDTCYSYSEDVPVYNPDGKEIIARDNEVSLLRKTDPQKAYFGCHTDITIPYDELAYIRAICPNGEEISIIEEGRFVLPGTELLNDALDNPGNI